MKIQQFDTWFGGVPDSHLNLGRRISRTYSLIRTSDNPPSARTGGSTTRSKLWRNMN